MFWSNSNFRIVYHSSGRYFTLEVIERRVNKNGHHNHISSLSDEELLNKLIFDLIELHWAVIGVEWVNPGYFFILNIKMIARCIFKLVKSKFWRRKLLCLVWLFNGGKYSWILSETIEHWTGTRGPFLMKEFIGWILPLTPNLLECSKMGHY